MIVLSLCSLQVVPTHTPSCQADRLSGGQALGLLGLVQLDHSIAYVCSCQTADRYRFLCLVLLHDYIAFDEGGGGDRNGLGVRSPDLV